MLFSAGVMFCLMKGPVEGVVFDELIFCEYSHAYVMKFLLVLVLSAFIWPSLSSAFAFCAPPPMRLERKAALLWNRCTVVALNHHLFTYDWFTIYALFTAVQIHCFIRNMPITQSERTVGISWQWPPPLRVLLCLWLCVCVFPVLWLACPMGWSHALVERSAGSFYFSTSVVWVNLFNPLLKPNRI